MNDLCQVRIKSEVEEVVNTFSVFHYKFPLKKTFDPDLINLNRFYRNVLQFAFSLTEFCLVNLEKNIEKMKSYANYENKDVEQQTTFCIIKAHLS